MKYTPKISVCMPTFNGQEYILEQLKSIIEQIGGHDEIIISDDNSSDNTIRIIKELNDNRIKIYTHEKVKNTYNGTYTNIFYVYKNVENALKYATGEYIFLADQDDIWLPNKVAVMMNELENGIDCVLHNNKVIDNQHNVIMDSYFTYTKPSSSLVRFITKCPYQGASMAFTKRIKDISLLFPNNSISHDHWIACCAWTHGKNISFVQEPLLLYRRHGNNVSPSAEKSPNSIYFKISYRFRLLYAYLTAEKRR